MHFSPVELKAKWQKYTELESIPFVLRMQEKAPIELGYLVVITSPLLLSPTYTCPLSPIPPP